MNDIVELTKKLVLKRKEGAWWDFKQQHHSNVIDLLHDILCLANVLHDGDRYIIFGVSDDYEIVGLHENAKRCTQADILDFLRKKSFANHHIPEITVETIVIDSMELDVLTIKNQRKKPYYLIQDEQKQGKTVRAGVVYSRFGDTNTPKNSCAKPYEVEVMWRERFGLDLKASERFTQVLLDFDHWQYDGISQAFYDVDPDYTIEIDQQKILEGQYWWEEQLVEKSYRYYYSLKYKKVELHKILVVRFQNENLEVPSPDNECLAYPDNHKGLKSDCHCDLFYYVKDSIKWSLLEHIRGTEVSPEKRKLLSTPIESQIKPPLIELPFLILESENDLKNICKRLEANFGNYIQLKEEFVASNEVALLKSDEQLFSEWAFELVIQDK